MIKYTYKGVEHTVNNTVTTLTTAQKYLEDNIIIEADGSGVIPTGEIRITENGTYNVVDKATAIVNVSTSGDSQYPIIEGEGEHEVRFVDYDGTLIKIQYVNNGESATAPSLPTHDRLTFVEWNRDYTNITHDLDVGALYKPTSGNTELFINVTEETGETITLNIYRTVSSGTITVNWGDGTTSNFATGTGAKALTHTYSSYGEYMISIITTVNYRLGGNTNSTELIRGSNEVNNFGALIKCYCSDKVIELGSYCCFNTYNLEEFTMISVTKTSMYCFINTKQKAVIIPDTVTSLGNRVATHSKHLEYLILNDVLPSYSTPLMTNTKVKKIINSAKYNTTSIGYLVYYDGCEYLWYPKPVNNYVFGTGFGQNCTNLRYIPIYDNCTGVTSTGFMSGSSIEKIAFPPSVTTIANQTCYNCGNLKDVYIYTDTVPTLGGTNAFGGTNALLKIHVKPELLSEFQNATNWSYSSIKNKLVGDLEGEFKDGYCQKISRN